MRIKLLLFTSFCLAYSDINDIYKYVNKTYKIKSINKDIQIKRLDIQQAKNNYYPQFNVEISYNIDDITQQDSNTSKNKSFNKYTSLNFDISQKIIDLQIPVLIEKAKSNLKYSKATKEYYINQLLFKLLPLYVSVIKNKEIIKLLKEKKENLKGIIEELENKNKFKFASKIEILKAKKQYIDIENRYIKLKYENIISKKIIQKILNHPIAFEEEKINTPTFLPKIDIQNPEIKMFKYKIEISKNEAKLKKTKFYPSANLNLQYNIDSYETYNQREFFASVSVNIPFFNKSDTTNYQSAKINIQKETLNFLDKKNEIFIQIEKIKLQFNQLKDILKNSYETLKLAKELNNQIEISFKNKLIDKSKYLFQKNKIIDIKIDIALKELKLIKLYINYLYLLGKIREERLIKLLF